MSSTRILNNASRYESNHVSSHEDLNALTGLRLFAALYVLFFHSGSHMFLSLGLPAWTENVLRNGSLGVSFFFTLSGFILTYTYRTTIFNYKRIASYIVNRFSRIYPVYMLSLFLSVFFLVPKFIDGLGSVLLLQSWVPAQAYNPNNQINFVAWTLSIEAFFYLSLPYVLKLSRSLNVTMLILCVVALAIVMIGLQLPSTWVGHKRDDFVFPFLAWVPYPLLRWPEFLMGVMIAHIYAAYPARKPGYEWMAVASAAITMFALTLGQDHFWRSVAAVTFGLIIFSFAKSDGMLARLLGSKPMLLLGGASYGIYIFQESIRKIIRAVTGEKYDLIGSLAYWPLLILFSVAVYVYVEQPARRWIKAWFAQQCNPVRARATRGAAAMTGQSVDVC